MSGKQYCFKDQKVNPISRVKATLPMGCFNVASGNPKMLLHILPKIVQRHFLMANWLRQVSWIFLTGYVSLLVFHSFQENREGSCVYDRSYHTLWEAAASCSPSNERNLVTSHKRTMLYGRFLMFLWISIGKRLQNSILWCPLFTFVFFIGIQYFCDDTWIFQRGDVSQVAAFVSDDFLQQPSHDFPWAGFRKAFHHLVKETHILVGTK